MLHTVILLLHSWLRWAVLALVVIVLQRSVKGARAVSLPDATDRKLGLFLMIATDLQLTLGLILLGGVSPIPGLLFSDFKTYVKDAAIRFYGMEHTTTMILAVVALHVARVLAKKRAAEPGAWHRAMTVGLVIMVALLLAGIPWPGLPWGRPLFRFG